MPRNIFMVFLAVGLAIAGGSAFVYATAWWRAAEGRTWPTTQAVIQSVDVETRTTEDTDRRRSSTVYYPRIAYRYSVGGRPLSGERIWLTGNDFYNDHADAIAFVQDYQVGQTVPVFYDPEHPGQSALLIENPPWQILLFTAFGLVWIGLASGFRLSDRRPARPQAPQAESQAVRALRSKGPTIVFLIAFVAIWAVGLYLMFG